MAFTPTSCESLLLWMKYRKVIHFCILCKVLRFVRLQTEFSELSQLYVVVFWFDVLHVERLV